MKVFKCKKEYVDLGFICFSPEKDYLFEEEKWNYIYLFDNYNRVIGISIDYIYDYFYTEAQVKAIRRKEIIRKLNN